MADEARCFLATQHRVVASLLHRFPDEIDLHMHGGVDGVSQPWSPNWSTSPPTRRWSTSGTATSSPTGRTTRSTRLTNGFSKKIENLVAAVSLHYMHYNFCHVHQTLGTTPAIVAGVTDHIWTVAEMCELLEPVAA